MFTQFALYLLAFQDFYSVLSFKMSSYMHQTHNRQQRSKRTRSIAELGSHANRNIPGLMSPGLRAAFRTCHVPR